MKNFISIAIVVVAVILGGLFLQKSDKKLSGKLLNTEIIFETDNFNYGLLEQGKPQTAVFSFRNTGKYPLLISNAEASCGCTSLKWPKKPIQPNMTEIVEVSYDAKSVGWFYKTITLFCNTEEGIIELTINGEVVRAD